MIVLKPADAAQAREAIAAAAADNQALDIVAGASKARLGRPARPHTRLDVSGLAGIVDYDPAELVLTARPATPMAEIERLLKAGRQMLAFEPPDWRGLLGGGGEPTLGGTIACNLAGPRRVRAGAARDHFLGFSAIDGRGDAWKAGGRVVKNVTGYDMCKMQAGAYGTLSLLTEISVRVGPRPETACTLLLHGLDDAAAVVLMARALNTPHEVSAAAHLPALVARRSRGFRLGFPGAATALRLEGPAPSVAFRVAALERVLGAATLLDAAETEMVWAEIGAVGLLLPPAGRCVWRVCPTPSRAPDIARALPDAEIFYDWGGGLLWLSFDAAEAGADGGAARVRASVRAAGGHASLVAAPDAVRAAVDVFEPEPAPLAALSQRIKTGFDPNHILNPGRIQEGR